MVNSVKQNTGESRPYGHDIGTEANFLPPMEAIERIEVIRGPMSSLYGSRCHRRCGQRDYQNRMAQRVDDGNCRQYRLQEHQYLGNTSQMNLFTMGPIVPDVLGLSVAADWLDRRDDDRNNYFGKHNRKSVDMTLGPPQRK